MVSLAEKKSKNAGKARPGPPMFRINDPIYSSDIIPFRFPIPIPIRRSLQSFQVLKKMKKTRNSFCVQISLPLARGPFIIMSLPVNIKNRDLKIVLPFAKTKKKKKKRNRKLKKANVFPVEGRWYHVWSLEKNVCLPVDVDAYSSLANLMVMLSSGHSSSIGRLRVLVGGRSTGAASLCCESSTRCCSCCRRGSASPTSL